MKSLGLFVNSGSTGVDFVEGEIDVFDMIMRLSWIQVLEVSIVLPFFQRTFFFL